MDDNRVIAPIDDNFQFDTSTQINTGTQVPSNVQYADQVPQIAQPLSTTEASFTPNAQSLMSPNSSHDSQNP